MSASLLEVFWCLVEMREWNGPMR